VAVTADSNYAGRRARETSIRFPENYDGVFQRIVDYKSIYRNAYSNKDFKGFSSSPVHLTQIDAWLNSAGVNKSFCVFTIRSYKKEPDRNSNLELLKELSLYLESFGYDTVWVPDADDYMGTPRHFRNICYAAASNLYLRTALYERARLCVVGSNGPQTIHTLNHNISFVVTRVVSDVWPVEKLEGRGFIFGSQPWAGERGYWNWENETYDNVKAGIDKVLRLLHRSPPLVN
jgi:hypothetical protein